MSKSEAASLLHELAVEFRRLLQKSQKRGATVLSIVYEEPTDEAIQEAIEQVKAELLKLGWTPREEHEWSPFL
jgi:hypothetical protein